MIDPTTKAKIHFVSLAKIEESMEKSQEQQEPVEEKTEGYGSWTDLRLFVNEDQLESRLGGTYSFEFNADDYWKSFNLLIGE